MGRWNPLSHQSSPSTSTSIPQEFLCPISHSLMADPVILPTDQFGNSFDRSSVLACAHLDFSPPGITGIDLLTKPLVLIPNVALRNAIFSWCDRAGIPRPLSVPLDDAVAVIKRIEVGRFEIGGRRIEGDHVAAFREFSIGADQLNDKVSMSFKPADRIDNKDQLKGTTYGALGMSIDRIDEKVEELGSKSLSPNTHPLRKAKKPSSSSFASTISTASSSSSSSSYTSADITIEPPPIQEHSNSPTFAPEFEDDDVEQDIYIKLRDHDQEPASSQLRQLTRESPERRLALCTPRLLAVLRPLLLSRVPGVQINATAALVNLSLEPQNKTKVIRSGLVPLLVEALKSPTTQPESRDNAAATLFSLALEEAHRVPIGVLGALPPLLALFANPNSSPQGHRDAGMALYHLSLASTNRSKLARAPGAVRALLSVAAESTSGEIGHSRGSLPLSKLAMMIVCNLASCTEGRGALMDGGAVAATVELLRSGMGDEEHCLVALYGISKGSLRFKGLAKSAGAERVLARVVESGTESNRELARRVVRVMRGEEDGGGNLATIGPARSMPPRFREDYDVSDFESGSVNSTAF